VLAALAVAAASAIHIVHAASLPAPADAAALAGASDATVKVHIKHLLRKLNMKSRLEAAVWALHNL